MTGLPPRVSFDSLVVATEIALLIGAEEFGYEDLLVALTGAGGGAAIMYMADPHEGARRRARLREAAAHATHRVTGAAVDNRLEAHAEAGHVPALQGPGPRRMPTVAAKWLRGTPTARLMATTAGLALLALAMPPIRARAAGGAAGLELLTGVG